MKKQKTKKQNTNKGITLIALVITIIVMLILVAVTITMAINGGLFEYARNAGTQTNAAVANEQLLASGQVTIDGQVYNSIDEFVNGNASTSLTLGKIYNDDMIGQPITYSANGQEDWIIFGKDKNGNILITTEFPIANEFELYGSAEKWVTYEDDLHTACAGYGGTIQGKNVTSRSITMDDINYVIGFTKPTVEIFTFGSTYGWDTDKQEWTTKEVNYYYPSAGAADNSYWQDPTIASTTFEVSNYRFYSYYSEWWYSREFDQPIPMSETCIRYENVKYICGDKTNYSMFNNYLAATRNVLADSVYACFKVAHLNINGISFETLCQSYKEGGRVFDYEEMGSYGVRPVVVLPSNLLVEEQGNGTYDLAK